jgi:quinol---cytochrome-c reductase cytochrome c subunit
VKSLSTRRRHPLAAFVVLALGLAFAGALFAAFVSPAASADTGESSAQQLADGKALYITSCSSCHGPEADGTSLGPSLVGVGSASVDFQVSTGRMPCVEQGAECVRKPVKFTQQQIYAIADYIASLGGGPAIPSADQVSTAGADTALGYQLFSANCSQCHGIGLAGGALTYGKSAPPLTAATPTQIYEAMLTGPEAMPVFGDGAISPAAKRDIIAYITQTRSETNPGGFSLGRIGTVTEGLVIWLGGLGFLVMIAMWITAKRRESGGTEKS